MIRESWKLEAGSWKEILFLRASNFELQASKRGQVGIETTVAVMSVFIFLLGATQVFLWMNRNIIERQRAYQQSRVNLGYSLGSMEALKQQIAIVEQELERVNEEISILMRGDIVSSGPNAAVINAIMERNEIEEYLRLLKAELVQRGDSIDFYQPPQFYVFPKENPNG